MAEDDMCNGAMLSDRDQAVVVMARKLAVMLEQEPPGPLREAPLFSDVIAYCRRVGPTWPVRLEEGKKADRRRPMLCGPLFTSVTFPWPMTDGRWLEPVVQLDLGELGQLHGLDVGQGLLQLWTCQTEDILRIVPPDIAAAAPLTPSPIGASDAFHVMFANWTDGEPTWADGAAITGFYPPVVDSGGLALEAYVDWVLEEAPGVSAASIRHAGMLKTLLLRERGKSPISHRAFGIPSESSFDPWQVPNVLFVIEPDPPRIADSAVGNDAVYLCYYRGLGEMVTFSVHGRGQ